MRFHRNLAFAASVLLAVTAARLPAATAPNAPRYGLIGQLTAKPGQRDALIALLIEASAAMPGCQNYIVAEDAKDVNKVWISEIWDSKASHDASLSLPAVRAAITRARPLIAATGGGVTTVPVGGYGLAAAPK